ncbi:hypothetical protein LMG28688_03210 [Paraburkholderia caffeinitolerans]|uniref:Thioesterase domain-containing protein n=1 Tax=Paraburkholderia caffeinitolerans TaxID=1723730 RepID=A0A6J5G1M1_9BURK|nr:PaaI family thioesterase [Paraburkholderia caffeinitolerans]CAB3791009.1 hypothetical protein LMG28688_03210 [Paraburkholderia caffeinitolerans]
MLSPEFSASEVAAVAHASIAAPENFEPAITTAAFSNLCGGFMIHRLLPIVGVRVQPEHLNSLGIAHGGFLATFVDSAFGLILRRDFTHTLTPTVHLGVDYLAPAKQGDWLEAHVSVAKVGRSVAHATCSVLTDGRTLLTSSGVFHVGSSTRRQDRSTTCKPPGQAT